MQDPVSEAEWEIRTAAELYQQGDTMAAEQRCRRVLALNPAHRDGRVLLGLVLLAQGRHDEAERIFAALAAQEPQELLHWSHLGTTRRAARRFDAALTAYSRAAQLGAASADFFYNVGLTHIDRLDFESARAVLARAVALDPTDAEICYRHAQACYESRLTGEASRALEGWEKLSNVTTEVAANIGYLLMNLGEAERAKVALDRAGSDPAPEPHVALTLVQALERTNRLSEARARFDKLAADPGARSLGVDLLLTEAQLAERESKHEVACALLEEALRGIRDFPERHFQLFRLAKCLDALRRYDEAFAVLQEAHRSQAAYFRLTAPAVSLRGIPTMSVTQYSCDANDAAQWDHSGAPSLADSPIFIVAFPRSGTTLLELTLDAHPLLEAMDEQPFLQNALAGLNATGAQYPEQLSRVTAAQLHQVRAAYWERVSRKVRLEPGQRLVDKNPLNILRLPVIRRLFPHARVLLAVRNPCDVLLSCYLQHFRSPDFALLCGDLQTLAVGYRRTMDFWYQQLGLLGVAVKEVRYESFVRNFETDIRGISEFLELPWDDGMLTPSAHARSKGFISTPSYSQVIQPVNQKAVGRWRAYEKHFADALPLLRPYLERWGYEV